MREIFVVLLIISTIILSVNNKNTEFLKKYIVSILISVLITGFCYYLIQYIYSYTQKINIEITAEGNGDVIFIGAMIDDNKWYWADQLKPISNWDVYEEHRLKYNFNNKNNTIDDKKLSISIPKAENISLGFKTGKSFGNVIINSENIIKKQSLYNKNEGETAVDIELVNSNILKSENKVFIILGTIFLVSIFLCIAIFNKYEIINNIEYINDSETWPDIFRIVLIFIIVLFHTTYNVFFSFTENIFDWYNILYINCFTGFAVPCFFMLSGSLLLRKDNKIKNTLLNRTIKFYGVLIIWGIIYIIINIVKFNENDNFIKLFLASFFKPYELFLWFGYSIVSLYFLLPILSYFKNLNELYKKYILIILLFIPSLIYEIQSLSGFFIGIPHFSLFWPDMGLFLWGYYLWEKRNILKNKKIMFFISLIFSYFLIIVETYYISIKNNTPQNLFFGNTGIGLLIMSTSIFALFMSFEDKFKMFKFESRKFLRIVSGIVMGIYFSHFMLIKIFGDKLKIFGIYFNSNTGTLLSMFLGAIFYFLLSAMLCYCCSNIPIIGWLFDMRTKLRKIKRD